MLLQARKKAWRCFDCDAVLRTEKAAWADDGPDPDCEKLPPASVDQMRDAAKARLTELREAQSYGFECQQADEDADDSADLAERELAEFNAIRGCRSVDA